MKQNLQITRITNLKKIIQINFDGNQSTFARAINKSPAQVNQWINGYRNIGNGIIYEIEKALKLEIGTLDKADNSCFSMESTEQNSQINTYSFPILNEKIKNQAFEIIKQYGMNPEQVFNLILHEIAATKKIPLHFDYLHSESE